jgi:hypothetical protein
MVHFFVNSLTILESFYTHVSEIYPCMVSKYLMVWVCRILYNSLNVLVDRSSDILTLCFLAQNKGWIEF